jgi:hypothetical protein
MSTEGIEESLHEKRGIEEIPSKNGVFSRTRKSPIEGACDSGDFSTRLDVLEAPQEVTKSSRNRPQSHAQRTKRGEPKLISWRPQSMKLMQIQKPGGHKEVRASFPDQFQYKVSKIHSPKSYSKERKGEEETDRKNTRGESSPRLGNRKVCERERGDLHP